MADTEALRVAALERDLRAVRAQRDKAVEALRELLSLPSFQVAGDPLGEAGDIARLLEGIVTKARAVLAELDGSTTKETT
jgi:hypothetical protein